jgi:glucose/arabinose dehydrogenase
VNRLAGETSPYLLQHAHNPVDWYPWGEEALAAASKLDRPIFLTFPPDGSNRIAVISQYGSIYMFPNDPKVEEPSEVLDIRKKVVYTDREPEEGMLGLAFHPKFRENRQFFVYYTTADHTNVLSRFTMSADDPNRADPASEQELFRTPKKPYWNHNAGTIIFGPDH